MTKVLRHDDASIAMGSTNHPGKDGSRKLITVRVLLAVILGTALFMTAYEAIERFLFSESLASLESHIVAILVFTTLATTASWGVLNKWAADINSSVKKSEALLHDVLDSVASNVAVLDSVGVILIVNHSWQKFALDNGKEPDQPARRTEIGVNYLDVCQESTGKSSEGAIEAYDGIRAVLDRRLQAFSLEYPCDSPDKKRWFVMHVNYLRNGKHGAVVSHTNITAIKQAETELKQYRDHLEELVASRTLDLEQANATAVLLHRASEERILIEAEARMKASKLEAVGTLAAGIAHDFNNILGSIVGYAEMTADDLAAGSSAQHNVGQILIAGLRARDLIARMLDFSRQREVQPVAVDMAAQVLEALALLRASLPSTVKLSFHSGMGDASAIILADPTQIQQIVMNLCINAAHAMDNRGTIGIAIEPRGRHDGAPSQYADDICLSVTDSGCGITLEVMERMFDPFFTTKEVGKGTGLGLSVVHGIVTGMGGVIEVHSRTQGGDTGTEIRVFLPMEKNHLHTGEMYGAHLVD